MKPTLIYDFTENYPLSTVFSETEWDVRAGNRLESFQALDTSLTYSYGSGKSVRTYTASPMHEVVRSYLNELNAKFGTAYNVCVLNYYADQKNSLGWHADDSPEQDPNHPICVLSFGAERYIFVKENGSKGVVPPEDRYFLKHGSCFIMPPGFQETHQHKIPRHDRECEPRMSMTFRKLDR